MSVWKNWIPDLLSDAGLPITGRTRAFMLDWHNHASSDCHNNPVDISRPHARSSDCKALPGTNRHAQNYAVSNDAQIAFPQQIHGTNFRHLLAALQTGDPYTIKNPGPVRDELKEWGSVAFAERYWQEAPYGAGGGPQPGPGNDAQTLKGWTDLQRSTNRHLPHSLRTSQHARKAALRELARVSRVLR